MAQELHSLARKTTCLIRCSRLSSMRTMRIIISSGTTSELKKRPRKGSHSAYNAGWNLPSPRPSSAEMPRSCLAEHRREIMEVLTQSSASPQSIIKMNEKVQSLIETKVLSIKRRGWWSRGLIAVGLHPRMTCSKCLWLNKGGNRPKFDQSPQSILMTTLL